MRHGNSGRKFGRSSAHRIAMTRNLMTALLLNGRIETTASKAKDLRRHIERLITEAKTGSLVAHRKAAAELFDGEAERKLFDTYVPRYRNVPGGYTRVLLTGPRLGDNTEMALIELTDRETVVAGA